MRMLVIAGLLCASAAGLAHASARPESARSPAQPARACHSSVRHGVLPTWARTGFSSPRPRLPHVLGRSGEIAALVFGYPLHAPPLEDRSNKILWVSRRAVKRGSDLRIHAQLMRGRQRVGRPVVRVVVGGPGPSGINLPSPGCWRLTLQWSGRTDHLDLEYEAFSVPGSDGQMLIVYTAAPRSATAARLQKLAALVRKSSAPARA